MNFIQLARETRKRSGLQGTGPASVSTTGYEAAIVTAVQDAWTDIQIERKDWKWMRSNVTFSISQGTENTQTYSTTDILGPDGRLNSWRVDTCYVDDGGQWKNLRYVGYDKFIKDTQNVDQPGLPDKFTIEPQSQALIFPNPDNSYFVKIDYQKSEQELESDSDTPELPVEFHKLIMYGAVMNYAEELGRQGKFSYYSVKYARAMNILMRNQLPRKTVESRPIV